MRSTRSKLPPRFDDFEVDLSLVASVSNDEPLTFKEAISGPNAQQWRDATQSEYDSMLKNRVWKLVDRPPNEKIVKCKWVFKTKYNASGKLEKFKARP